MAEVLRYINPASTAGGDGTTNATTGASRAYASMSEWNTAEATDLVSAGDTHRVVCSSGLDAVASVAVTAGAGWTTDASNYITIEADPSDGHGGVYGAGYRLEITTSGYSETLVVNVPNTVIKGITIENTSGAASARGANINAIAPVFDSCFFVAVSSTGSCAYISNSDGGLFTNCVAIAKDAGTTCFNIGNFDYATFYNCTAISGSRGYYRIGTGGTSAEIKNCVAYGASTADMGGTKWTASSKNATSDTSAIGTSPVTNITTAAFVDYAGGDYSPEAGGALDGAGSDLSAFFTHDITGATRTQWDIGAWAVAASGGGFQAAWARGSNQVLGGFNP